MDLNTENTITEVTRRDIFDTLTLEKFHWSGRYDESEFLARLFDLDALPSTDHRHSTAREDIVRHREMNDDWEDDWVFYDSRFNLFRGPDESLLKFFCLMLHPTVQAKPERSTWLLEMLNRHLANDGWEIASCSELSGRPVFAARRLLEGASFAMKQAQSVAQAIDAGYVSQQITRMEAALRDDPELAIGTAKELTETICKTVLTRAGVTYGKSDELPQLVKATLKQLKLTPDDIPDSTKAAETIRILLLNLGTIAKALAELRNPYGTGHGKEASSKGLETRHARLAVNAATTLSVFMFETFQANETGF